MSDSKSADDIFPPKESPDVAALRAHWEANIIGRQSETDPPARFSVLAMADAVSDPFCASLLRAVHAAGWWLMVGSPKLQPGGHAACAISFEPPMGPPLGELIEALAKRLDHEAAVNRQWKPDKSEAYARAARMARGIE